MRHFAQVAYILTISAISLAPTYAEDLFKSSRPFRFAPIAGGVVGPKHSHILGKAQISSKPAPPVPTVKRMTEEESLARSKENFLRSYCAECLRKAGYDEQESVFRHNRVFYMCTLSRNTGVKNLRLFRSSGSENVDKDGLSLIQKALKSGFSSNQTIDQENVLIELDYPYVGVQLAALK